MPYKDKEKQKQFHRDYHQKRKAPFLEVINSRKSGGCVGCGETDFCCLCFHHLSGERKRYNVSSILRYKIEMDALVKELDECIVLCFNCHAKAHKYGNSYVGGSSNS
jgi:hypothetical protein